MSKQNDVFKVKFRGVRGSYPTPEINKIKYGGNTSCLEIRAGKHIIILDAGTGIISLGEELLRSHIASGIDSKNRNPIELTLLISHSHLDHIMGLQYFKPLFIPSTEINIFGPGSTNGKTFKTIITDSVFTPFFPLDFEELQAQVNINDIYENKTMILREGKPPELLNFNLLDEQEISPDDVMIHCLKSYAHPKDGVLIYKIIYKNRSVVYATDKESYAGGDIKLINFARNADLLIHDAQYTTEDYTCPVHPRQGFGHSTPEMAIDSAIRANVKKLVLFHLDPTYDDKKIDKIDLEAQLQFKNATTAYENLEINIL